MPKRAGIPTDAVRPIDSRTTIITLVSITLGSLAAFLTVPAELGGPSALVEAAVFQTIGLLLPVVIQTRSDLSSFLRVQNFILVGLVYWLLLDLLQSAYTFDATSAADARESFLLIGLFALFVVLGSSGRGWKLPAAVAANATRTFSTRTLFASVLVAFILGIANFVIKAQFNPALIFEGLTGGRWAAAWARGSIGGTDSILDHFQYFGYVLPSLAALIAIREGWLSGRVIAAIIFSLIVILFLAQSGGRRIVGVVVGAAILTSLAARPRLRLGALVIGGLVVVLTLFFMQEMLRYRNVGFGAFLAGEVPEVDSHLHVDDNFLRLSQLVGFFPNTEHYVFFGPVWHSLTLPIPRILWPGKPMGPGFDLPLLLGMDGVSLSSSILGELYVSFGVWAIALGGFVLGRIAGMWNKLLLFPAGASRSLLYAVGVMAIFAGLRSMQALMQMSYVVLAWLAISALLPKERSNNVVVAPKRHRSS